MSSQQHSHDPDPRGTARRPDPRGQLGREGEQLACAVLADAGLHVVARNWRCRLGEIDIVAAGPGLLVFCEVKTRRGDGYGTPTAAVTPAKQARLRHLAAAYLAGVERPRGRVRFDVVTVTWPRGSAPTRRTPHSVRLAVSRADSRSVRRTCYGRCLACCDFGHRLLASRHGVVQGKVTAKSARWAGLTDYRFRGSVRPVARAPK
jgi:putative endonuclease